MNQAIKYDASNESSKEKTQDRVQSMLLPEDSNKYLEDLQASIMKKVDDITRASRIGEVSHVQPRYGNLALWLEQFFASTEMITVPSNFSSTKFGLNVRKLMSALESTVAFSPLSLNNSIFLPPSYNYLHRVVADYLFASGIDESIYPELDIPGVSENVFNWDTSVLYSGDGVTHYEHMVRSASGTYDEIYSILDSLYEMFMNKVSNSLIPQRANDCFTSGLLFVGPSQSELERVLRLQNDLYKLNPKRPRKCDVFVMTQSLKEMLRAAEWSRDNQERVNVSVYGYDIRDLQQDKLTRNVINRSSGFRLDSIMKGLTSGNFSELQIRDIIKSLTRPDDKFYMDFQAPKYIDNQRDMTAVCNAYATEDMIRFFSWNFKIFLQRLGVKSEWLHEFESFVKVSACSYQDPIYDYASAVVNHVNLDDVNTDIIPFLSDNGYNFPSEVILCRSIRREKEGFQTWLDSQDIKVYDQQDLKSDSGDLHYFVLEQEKA